MGQNNLYGRLSKLYLFIVPPVVAILGFTVSNISYKVYLPLWIVNTLLMIAACVVLSNGAFTDAEKERKELSVAGLLLLAPWILFAMFAGMGGPPSSYAEWLSNETEQKVRYSLLIVGGILLLAGFAVASKRLQHINGNLYALISIVCIVIAMILFILNMAYWHSFLPETFRIEEADTLHKMPEWFKPIKAFFLVITIIEVSLTYLAAALLAMALKTTGLFTKTCSNMYIVIGMLAFIIVALYGCYPASIVANGFPFYPFMIPAIPFVIPYYIGVNLLIKAGKSKPADQ